MSNGECGPNGVVTDSLAVLCLMSIVESSDELEAFVFAETPLCRCVDLLHADYHSTNYTPKRIPDGIFQEWPSHKRSNLAIKYPPCYFDLRD